MASGCRVASDCGPGEVSSVPGSLVDVSLSEIWAWDSRALLACIAAMAARIS